MNVDLFYSKIDKDGPLLIDTPCWQWIGNRDVNGYGKYSTLINKKQVKLYPHRMIYEFETGPIPNGAFICHKCDNASCVNPSHLYAGTRLDNAKDAKDRNRLKPLKGSKHNNTTLTEIDVTAMRTLYRLGKKISKIAVQFGVSYECCRRIIRRDRWKHVTT